MKIKNKTIKNMIEVRKNGSGSQVVTRNGSYRKINRKMLRESSRHCLDVFRQELANFRDYPPSKDLFLDARYWDLVFRDYEHFSKVKFVISVSDNYSGFRMDNLRLSYDGCPNVILMKLIVKSNGVKISTHNIVMIYYPLHNVFVRYNPSGKHDYDDLIDRTLQAVLPTNVQYTVYYGEEYHHCVASCIYFVLSTLAGMKDNMLGYEDTRRFVTAIKQVYGPIEGQPLIELGDFFGNDNFSGTGAVVGGLGGGLLGGLVAGPMGLVVGGVGGALIGGMAWDD